LQVIVLSCDPERYAGFGASHVTLKRVPNSGAETGLQPVVPGSQPPRKLPQDPQATADTYQEPDSCTARGTPRERQTKFLQELKNANGQCGNQSLREALGWNEASYASVKSDLVSAGKITLGRGRGGSVALTQRET
jgi:hypothetical protein